MKNLTIFILAFVTILGFNACKTEDDVVFVIQEGDVVAFTNTFSPEYVLTPATSGNLGERFTWDDTNFGEPTNVTYELQRSNSPDFSNPIIEGATSGNEISKTIGDLLGYANEIGLDADPSTPAPNSGTIYWRLSASVGTGGGNATVSESQPMVLTLPEDTGGGMAVCELDQLWLVGAGVKFAGWSWDTPNRIGCTGDGVYSGNIDFTNEGDANFRFFEVETDWASGLNFLYFTDEGYTIDPLFENAMDDDNNFKFIGTSGLYYLEIDTINKTITLNDPTALGECENDQLWIVGAGVPDAGWSWDTPIQTMCNGEGVYSGFVNLSSEGDANFRFFTVATDWASGRNYLYYVDQGYTIDPNFEDAMDDDNNFKFIGTSGAYFLTVDDINKVISIE
tara:strand:+ start:16233 stop:17414 length:1182 start_codon:yes stop_codon:yes gene_type:complete